MTPVTCAEVAELAAELALGTLPGDQRAAVLAHLDGCGECRRLVKELADTADILLDYPASRAEIFRFLRRGITVGNIEIRQPVRRSVWIEVLGGWNASDEMLAVLDMKVTGRIFFSRGDLPAE